MTRSTLHPPPHRPPAPRAARRAFTLLEVMLAAILGAMVLLACVGLFGAIDRQTLAGRHRFQETLELSTAHATIERAIQLLVMSDAPAPVEPRSDAPAPDPAAPPAEPPEGEAAADVLTPSEPPRFELAFDPALSGSIELHDGRRIAPQRLEVSLLAAPIFVPSAPRVQGEEPERESRRERRAREEAELEDPASVEISIAPGVRGAFELVEIPGELGSTWELWWRQLGADAGSLNSAPLDSAQTEVLWPEGMAPGAVRLASDLTRVHWRIFRGNNWLDEWSATWPDDLPAYVELELATVHGGTHQWLFEVGWTTGKDPGTQTTTQIEPETADPANNPGGTPQRPGNPQPLPPAGAPAPNSAPKPGGKGAA